MAFKAPVLVKTSSNGGGGEATEQRVLKIESDDPADTATGARLATGVPRVGDEHDEYPTMTVRNVRSDLIENSAYVFLVTVDYSDKSDPNQSEDPLDRDPEVDIEGVEVEADFYQDEDGNFVLNSALDSFDPQPTRKYYDGLITVSLNVATINSELYDQYRGAVNSDAFPITFPDGTTRTFPAFTVKMGNIKATFKREKGTTYWRVTFPLMYRKPTEKFPHPWNRYILDEGYYAWDDTDNKYRIKIKGKDVTSPQLLDGNGQELASMDPHDAVTLEYRDSSLLDFGDLNLTG